MKGIKNVSCHKEPSLLVGGGGAKNQNSESPETHFGFGIFEMQ